MSQLSTQNKIAWHYTTGINFIKIVESGFLLPTSSYIEDGEKPILWFSTAKYWANTACKATYIDGQVVTLSMRETMRLGKGLVRFGTHSNELIKWKLLPKKASMRRAVAKSLEVAGKKQGSIPRQWRGSLPPIAISDCICIQVMNDLMQWVEVSA